MKNSKIKLMLNLFVISVFAAGCTASSDTSTDPGAAGGTTTPATCSKTISSGASSGVELCAISGAVRHVKISGLKTNAGDHSSASLALGFDSFPGANPGSIATNQMRVQWYGGGNPAPAAQADVYYGGTAGTNTTSIGNTAYTSGVQTICFDIVGDVQPQFIYWVSGVNSADCDNASTLTLDRAVVNKLSWGTADAEIASGKKNYFYASSLISSTPTVTLSTTSVLSNQCTTELGSYATGTYQELCSPGAGAARFFVIQGIHVPASNAFSYLFLGYASTPSSSTTFAAGQFAVVAGKSAGATDSFTFLRNTATAQYNPAGPTGVGVNTPNIFATGSTNQEICYEVGTGSGTGPRIVVWYTGTNGANCATRTGLTQANSVLNYDAWTDALTLGKAYYRFSNTASFNAARIIASSKRNL